MEQNHQECILEGEIIIPLEKNIILSFFGTIAEAAQCRAEGTVNGGRDEPFSVSTIVGYRSALLDYYKSREINLGDDVAIALHNFMDGYENIVSGLRKDGKMKICEGKKPLSFEGMSFLQIKMILKFILFFSGTARLQNAIRKNDAETSKPEAQFHWPTYRWIMDHHSFWMGFYCPYVESYVAQ